MFGLKIASVLITYNGVQHTKNATTTTRSILITRFFLIKAFLGLARLRVFLSADSRNDFFVLDEIFSVSMIVSLEITRPKGKLVSLTSRRVELVASLVSPDGTDTLSISLSAADSFDEQPVEEYGSELAFNIADNMEQLAAEQTERFALHVNSKNWSMNNDNLIDN